jgi:hypothetical protein
MANALAIVPTRGLTQAELIDIENLFDKLAKAAGIANKESRNIRMTPARADEVVASAYKLIKEIRDLWEWDSTESDEPEADL